MPELPEVETTVLSLKEKVLGKTFVSVWAEKDNGKIKKVEKRKIEKVERHGKGIYIFLDNKTILFIHLRMTGHLLLGNWERKKDKRRGKEEWKSNEKILQDKKNGFLRYIFFLNNGNQLALSDPRKFAEVSLLTKEEAENYKRKLGPEPFLLKKEEFWEIIKKSKKQIKPLLMDQQIIAGIGNIYAADILFKARINPQKKANLLKRAEGERIYNAMQELLQKGIKLKGDSTSDYRLITGEKGGYQKEHLVYNRKGMPCFVCKKEVKRIIVGGRGTYYCPICQN
jgi:formamidopyrimidine-DNA glycosylase